MRITPLDIHHKEFRRALRGYNEEEVDAFLDELAAEFERFYKENAEVKEKCMKYEEKIDQYENIEQTLQNTLITAQKSADEIQGNAKKEAELVIRDSQLRAKEMIRETEKEREKMLRTINSLRQAEEEFRLKFRSQLESYLGLVDEIENQSRAHFDKEDLVESGVGEEKAEFTEPMEGEKGAEKPLITDANEVDEEHAPVHAAPEDEGTE
ncbi:MAG: DivIVA domain-containing protein [Terriglobia bacterium]